MAGARPDAAWARRYGSAAAVVLLATMTIGGGEPPQRGEVLVADPAGWRAAPGPVLPQPSPTPAAALDRLTGPGVTVLDATLGDVDGDGADEVVAVLLRPARPTLLASTLGTVGVADPAGRTLHLGVYDVDPATGGLAEHWVAGTVLQPISAVAACGSTLVLGYASRAGATDTVAVGVLTWHGYGFTASAALPDLPGTGTPACADVDGDRLLDPVVLGGSPP